jgi:transcriptional regulator with XRE-family HTH domain
MAKRRHVLNEWGQALAKVMAASKDLKTQTALAKKSGVGQATIGRILRGEVDPQIGTMMVLARALRVPFKTLAAVCEGEKADHDAVRFAAETLDRVIDQLRDAHSQLAGFHKELQP